MSCQNIALSQNSRFVSVIYDDGYSLFLAMDKSLELEITNTWKYSYDKCGFFAFATEDSIQTLVGSHGKQNYVHDFKFNSKKIKGTSFLKNT